MRKSLIALFCAIAAMSVSSHAATPDFPQSVIVTAKDGVPIVVQEWGDPDGPPILLIHGFSFGAISWKNQIGDLARHARIIAFDLRGHGLSGKPWDSKSYTGSKIWANDVAAVLAAKGVKRPTIVGWSFGGFVAIDYLRHCKSDCASGLVLVSSLAGLVEPAPQPNPEASGLPAKSGDVRADDYHALFEGIAWTSRVMTIDPVAARVDLQKQLVLAMTPPYVRRAIRNKRLDNRDMVQKLRLPVLIMRGGRDSSIPHDKIAEIAASLRDAQMVEFANAGHSPFEESTEQFNDDLMAFVARTRQPR